MKTIEQIEEEYQKYKKRAEYIKDYDGFLTYVEIGIDDLEEDIKNRLKEKSENLRWQLAGKIRNFFFFIFEQEEVELYDDDNQLIDELIALASFYIERFREIQERSSQENYEEFIKLIDFATDYYNQHFDYIESKRDGLELIYKGFQYYNYKYEDNREIFAKFFRQKINQISPTKAVEKSKKI